jgi:hypothetical protein
MNTYFAVYDASEEADTYDEKWKKRYTYEGTESWAQPCLNQYPNCAVNGKTRIEIYQELVAAKPLTPEKVRHILGDEHACTIQCEVCDDWTERGTVLHSSYDDEDRCFCGKCMQGAVDNLQLHPKRSDMSIVLLRRNQLYEDAFKLEEISNEHLDTLFLSVMSPFDMKYLDASDWTALQIHRAPFDHYKPRHSVDLEAINAQTHSIYQMGGEHAYIFDVLDEAPEFKLATDELIRRTNDTSPKIRELTKGFLESLSS